MKILAPISFVLSFCYNQVACGWKPGAISKCLLRKLNKAKRSNLGNEEAKPVKKVKKRVETKPTLIISRKDGEYRVEMQVTDKDNGTDYIPVVYTIASESNVERQKQKETYQRRVIRKAVDKLWLDPYHPEVCEDVCYKAYQHAIGVQPYNADNPDCICSDEDNEIDASCPCADVDYNSDNSLDVDWEIHYSPPTARR